VGSGKAFEHEFPVGAEIVQDEVETLLPGVTRPESLPGLEEVPGCLAAVDNPLEDIAVNVVEAQELLRSCCFVIRGANALWVPLPGPGHTGDRTEFHRTEFVEAHGVSTRRSFRIEFQNAVFFTSKSGSGDSFQVFVRWSVTPSLLRRRRIHSSV